MQVRFRHVFAASLLASTAIVPAAMAQTDSCEELNQVIEDNQDRFEQQWLDEARGVFEQGDPEVCVAWVEAAERAQGGAEEGAEASMTEDGRLIVEIPEPTVTVEQVPPEILVTQPEPQVTVRQPEPEIIVRQAQPTVTIQMPQPTVTIDQPQPEIIVRMPEPVVEVTQAQPQIEVQEAQPIVEVEQGEPEVAIAEGEEEAQVQVQDAQPIVRLAEPVGEPQVTVERAEPRVTFEQAEPQVQVEQGGEPQVEFSQSGEPNVTVEQAGEAAAAEDDPAALGAVEGPAAEEGAEAPMVAAADWRGERELLTAPAIEREGFAQIDPTTISLEEIQGANVYGANDEEIAEIGDVIVSEEGTVEYFVMDVGGFLGIGTREVAVGFDEVTVLQAEGGDEYRVYLEATQEQLENLPEYEAG